MRRWLGTLLLLGACKGGEDLGSRVFACRSDADCADGFSCVNGLCAAGAGSDAGVSFDAGTSADAGGAIDAGFDAGQDAGVDAGVDAGFDAGPGSLLDGGFVDLPGDGGCVLSVALAVDPASGRLGMAWVQGTSVLYSECASGCTAAGGWSSPAAIESRAVSSCLNSYQKINLAFMPAGNPVATFVNDTLPLCPVRFEVPNSVGGWSATTVANSKNCGAGGNLWSDLAVTNGTPLVAFHGASPSSVWYAPCVANCATTTPSFAPQMIADGGTGIGRYVSIAVEPATGLPRLAFDLDPAASVYFATCANIGGTCAAGTGAWSSSAFDPTGTSFALSLGYGGADGGAPSVAYLNGSVRYAVCGGGACGGSVAWSRQQVEAVSAGSSSVAMRFAPDGTPRIAYVGATDATVRLARPDGGGWQHVLVDRPAEGHVDLVAWDGGWAMAYSMGSWVRFTVAP